MVVTIYYYIGYKYKVTTWYLTGFPNGSNLGATVFKRKIRTHLDLLSNPQSGGKSYYFIVVVQGRGLKRNCTRNILIEKNESRKFMLFANRNTQKNMQLLDKIHFVFTAALTSRR